jgi:hypothetical protein
LKPVAREIATGKENLQEISNDNDVRVVNVSMSTNLIDPHCNIHKQTWTSDMKMYTQTDYILVVVNRRQH